jgi:hypothetical protein
MKLSFELKDKKLKANIKRDKHAVFSTDALVNHSATEFRLTFFDTWITRPSGSGGIAQSKDVVSEVILTPTHLKALSSAINDNLRKYESRFGEIEMPKPRAPQDEEQRDQTESYAYL